MSDFISFLKYEVSFILFFVFNNFLFYISLFSILFYCQKYIVFSFNYFVDHDDHNYHNYINFLTILYYL